MMMAITRRTGFFEVRGLGSVAIGPFYDKFVSPIRLFAKLNAHFSLNVMIDGELFELPVAALLHACDGTL